ncbi:MAG: glutamate formiminotransferase / 5-formyltetrahydrofolate cyclo-ligase [Thermoleophilaceae bacterium]|nr:glutamate formiminotransferase / 5-formyltetrahydrofolate cyclo-ligase [Thermoleophilaceae bacterium]MEA2469048.1 glutamate formiminotransferase / 5-formyltetrahydrofolate cyclo-ligase [Thermoleophilaceae bacterium]
MQSRQPILMAVPNVSEGRDRATIAAIGAAFAPARLLDTHSDPDHGRSVFTLAARQGELARALVNGARAALERVDLTRHSGDHPHVGAVDVAPVVYLDEARRGAACAEALTAGALMGDELGLPVFLYGELADGRERAEIRRGGLEALARSGLVPDYGPHDFDPRKGAVLVAARPPLVAFNIDLASDDIELAKEIAGEIRESGPNGLPGVRAIGLRLPARGCAQVSTNVHDFRMAPLAEIVRRVRQRAPVARIELVGLAPRAALVDLQEPGLRSIEEALGSEASHGPDEEEAPA